MAAPLSAPSIATLVDIPELGLRPLVIGDSWGAPLDWVHGTDLLDPVPFLRPGQLVLTTGGQFEGADQERYDGYVDRLAGLGIHGIGYGPEVVRSGDAPEELVRACRRAGMSLVEVPYRTPFIAVARRVADGIARAARAREDWARDAQHRISLAALGDGGIDKAVATASRVLDRGIALFGPDARVAARHPLRLRPAQGGASDAARELLRAGERASVRLPDAGGELQTLGRAGALRGVLAVLGPRLDRAERSVVTTLVALAEVALDGDADRARERRRLARVVLGLLLDGQADAVRRLLGVLDGALPEPELAFLAVRSAAVGPTQRAQLESRPEVELAADRDDVLLLLAAPPDADALAAELAGLGLAVGVSSPATPERAASAALQASRALRAAVAGEALDADALATTSLLGLLSRDEVAGLAAARLATLAASPDAEELLACARAWFAANCQWDPAARGLGIHRHSLQARITRLGALLGLPLDEFGGRAELWAVLAAASPAE